MRLPPAISAALLRRSTKQEGSDRSSGSGATLVRERSEEGRALVRVAPLRAKGGACEDVLRGHTHRRGVHRCERVEPLHRAAGRIVREMLADLERSRNRIRVPIRTNESELGRPLLYL